MRIAFVSQYYAPEPSRVPTSIARGLARRGHSVNVVTGFPNYPHGEIYPGYRQSLRHIESDGASIKVRRVPLVASHSGSGLMRAANYLSFMFSALLATRFTRGAAITYVYASQPTGALAALFWKLSRGTPYVMHVQDLWPDSITASNMVPDRVSSLIARAVGSMLRPLYAHASAVIAISPQMRSALIDRGADADRVHVIYNWSADETLHTGTPPSSAGCTVTYAGNMGSAQGLETAIHAARAVTPDLPGFRLLFVGTGTRVDALRRLAADLPSVEFRDRVPADQMPSIYAETSYQLVSLKNSAMLNGAVPSKLQASLAAGLPVICATPGDAPAIVDRARAGLVAPPGDVDALAAAFREAYHCPPNRYAEYAQCARAFYEQSLSESIGMTQLEALLVKGADGASTRRGADHDLHHDDEAEGRHT